MATADIASVILGITGYDLAKLSLHQRKRLFENALAVIRHRARDLPGCKSIQRHRECYARGGIPLPGLRLPKSVFTEKVRILVLSMSNPGTGAKTKSYRLLAITEYGELCELLHKQRHVDGMWRVVEIVVGPVDCYRQSYWCAGPLLKQLFDNAASELRGTIHRRREKLQFLEEGLSALEPVAARIKG